MGHPGMHYAPMGMHPMGQRANMPPVPHGMMPQMMPPMGGPPMGQVRMFCFVFICLLLPVVFLCQRISKSGSILAAVCFILCQNNVLSKRNVE